MGGIGFVVGGLVILGGAVAWYLWSTGGAAEAPRESERGSQPPPAAPMPAAAPKPADEVDTVVERADPELMPDDAETVVEEEPDPVDTAVEPEPVEPEPVEPEPVEPEPAEPEAVEPQTEETPPGSEPLEPASEQPESSGTDEPPEAEPSPNPSAVVPEDAIDVNSASAGELEALPGVGPVLAARIVAYRKANGPYASVDELSEVKGVGPSMLQGFRARAVARPVE